MTAWNIVSRGMPVGFALPLDVLHFKQSRRDSDWNILDRDQAHHLGALQDVIPDRYIKKRHQYNSLALRRTSVDSTC